MAGGISLTLLPDKTYNSKYSFYAWFVGASDGGC